MQALLQLDDYWLDYLTVKGSGSAPASLESISVLPDIDFEVFGAPEDVANGKESYLVQLKVSASKAKVRAGVPYEFQVQLSGVFSFLPETESTAKPQFIYYNAPAMLYGIARGIIGELTATGRQKRYILPSVNFQEIYKRLKKRRDRRNSKQPA